MNRRSIFNLFASATLAAAIEVTGLAPKILDIDAMRRAFVERVADAWEASSVAWFYQKRNQPAP